MMSRGVGLISVLLAMTVALAACNGDSSGTSASQATGVANSSASPAAAAQSNDSTSTEAATEVAAASPLPCDVAATANTPCSAAHSVTRLLTKSYRGPLFQVQRASDNTS